MKKNQMKKNSLKNNLKEIYKNINAAKQHNQDVKLLAVTKTHPPKKIKEAIKLGIKQIGENRVQEAEEKIKQLPTTIETHFIGRLQSNKINKALALFDVIQTVDSFQLAEKINQKSQERNKQQRIFCQINIGNDPHKGGFSKDELDHINNIMQMKNLNLEGLMTILPLGTTKNKDFFLYTQMKNIKQQIDKLYNINLELSMGMSNDYTIAIECGATMVRIGTSLFGGRAEG